MDWRVFELELMLCGEKQGHYPLGKPANKRTRQGACPAGMLHVALNKWDTLSVGVLHHGAYVLFMLNLGSCSPGIV